MIQGIPASLRLKNPIDSFLEVVQKVTLAGYIITDHVGLALRVAALPAA